MTCTWTQTDHEATECHLTLDPTKFNHWQLQNVLRIYVGWNLGWHRPNYKMSLGQIMLAIRCSAIFNFRCIGFCSADFELFSIQKELCSLFCSCKKGTCTAFCGCVPYAFRCVPTKSHCTTSPPLSEPWLFFIMHLLPLQRKEYQKEANWYGLPLHHIHPQWLSKLPDDVCLQKLLGLSLDVHHTQSSW